MEEKRKSVFDTLNSVNVNEHVEQKDTGRVKLSYLSWAWAWAEVKKRFPDAAYTVYENRDGWCYFTDGRTCWVKTGVTINGLEHIEYLPVMDNRNASVPAERVTSFDVNKAIQRSLTKACARHGLGLYIYAGEDLPEPDKLFCAECGAEIKGVGKHSAEYVAELTLKKYGAQLCGTCAERRKAAMTAAETKKEETV